MSTITSAVELLIQGTFGLMYEYGIFVAILATIGLLTIISSIFTKIMGGARYIFMIFIALPLIVIIALMKKDMRKERIKELGEIYAFAKEHPDRTKRTVYLLVAILFVIVVFGIAYWLITSFGVPIYELNEYTKNLTINSTI